MISSENSLKLALVLGMFLILSSNSMAEKFEAGVVSQTEISRTYLSDRWIGVSGTVERGDSTEQGLKVGSIQLNSSQTGEVVSTEIEGIKGGGYYLAFTPLENGIDASKLRNVSVSDLEKNGIFTQELFPDFYPDYTSKYDNPVRTFQPNQTLRVGNQVLNSSFADIGGDANMYLLSYDNGSENLPVFLSPVDGFERGNSFDNCFVSACNFQALLPAMNSSNFTYSVNLLAKGEIIEGCGEAEEESLVLNPGDQNDCIQVNSPGSYLDFYGSEVEDGGECTVTVEADNTTLRDVEVSDSTSAICVDSGEAEVIEGNLTGNDIGITAENGEIRAEDVSLKDTGIEVALQDSRGELENVSLEGSNFYGEADSVTVESYEQALPFPTEAPENFEATGAKVEITANSNGNSSWVKNLGFGYPDIDNSSLLPEAIYKYDNLSGENIETEELPVDLVSTEGGRYARHSGNVSNFSIFSLYAREIKGNQSNPGSGEDSSAGSGGSSGSGGGGGGGAGGAGAGGGAGPGDSTAAAEPVVMNLSLEKEFYNANRGDTISFQFELNNTGDVGVENASVDLDSGWASVPRTFDAINPGEVRSGVVLSTVPEDASVGNRTFDLQASYRGNEVDSENLTVNVSEVVERERIEVIESPTFVSLTSGERESIGVQVENPTPRPIRSVKASFRGENCAVTGDQTFDIPAESTKNVRIDIKSSGDAQVCNDAVVFRKDDDIIGFFPVRIEVGETSQKLLSIPVYLVILAFWSSLLLLRLKYRGKDEFRWN